MRGSLDAPLPISHRRHGLPSPEMASPDVGHSGLGVHLLPTPLAVQASPSTTHPPAALRPRRTQTMEPGSCSRLSWADEVEANEASRGAASPTGFNLPSLAAAAHAAFMLQACSLDPDAEPFVGSPGGSEARLPFSDSEASVSDPKVLPASAHGKISRPRRQRRRRHRRPRRGTFLADARRSPPSAGNCLASIIVHPPRMSVEPDAKGFRAVKSWRR